ncbi:PaaI family thioesterase [Bacteroidota bacterium]
MSFYEEGDEIICKWNPDAHYQGYINVLHGGIQSTLMDEIASWVVFVKLKTGGVTSKLTTSFRKPVQIDSGELTIRARCKEKRSRIAFIEMKLYNGKGVLCSESIAEYFLLSEEKARASMNFPAVEDFYE